jgi:CHAD domain-containing protein
MATTAGDVLLAYLADQLDELRRHDPGVRANEPESIHQMRVASRRLRSLLGTGRSLFDGGAAEDVRAELRWLSRALGAARDPAVVHGRLKDLLASEPQDMVHGAAAERINEELDATEAAGFEAALAALGSERYTRLLANLKELVAAPALSDKASRPPRRIIRKLVSKDEARLRRAVEALPARHGSAEGGSESRGSGADGSAAGGSGAGGSDARDLGLHDVRKAAKRLRYASEFATPLMGKGRRKRTGKVARSARDIQTILGGHQDSVVARTLLGKLGTHPQISGASGFTFGRLYAREDHLAAAAEAKFTKAWRKFPKPPG